MARRKPKAAACRERTDGAIIHRTVPIHDRRGRWLGATCPCGAVVTSPRGGQSRAELFVGPFARVVRSKTHRDRIANARVARKLGRKRARAASRA